MALDWSQVEGGDDIRDRIISYAKPKFLHIEHITLTNDGQVAIYLDTKPEDEPVKMYINHLCYYEGHQFTVNRNNTRSYITWTAGTVVLEKTDDIVVEYWSYSKT